MLTPETLADIEQLSKGYGQISRTVNALVAELKSLSPPPAALSADRTYEDVCKRECEWCMKGKPRNEYCWNHHVETRPINNGHGLQNIFEHCTAPSRDELIARLLKERKNG